MTSLYYDIATLAVLLICFFIFYVKGFVSSALQLVGFAGALVVAYITVTSFSKMIYDRFIYPWLLGIVSGRIEDYMNGGEEGAGLIGQAIMKYIDSSGASGPDALAEKIMEGSVGTVSFTTLKVIMFAVVFLLAFLLIKLLASLLTNLNDVPVVGDMNKALGGAFGLVIGITAVILVSALLHILQGHFSASWLDENVMQNTYLYRFFYNNNPLIG